MNSFYPFVWLVVKGLEWVYIGIERFMKYPEDHHVLGLEIDDDLQSMSRKDLCQFIDDNSPARGMISFWRLPSTSKIRFGCQLIRIAETRGVDLTEPNK